MVDLAFAAILPQSSQRILSRCSKPADPPRERRLYGRRCGRDGEPNGIIPDSATVPLPTPHHTASFVAIPAHLPGTAAPAANPRRSAACQPPSYPLTIDSAAAFPPVVASLPPRQASPASSSATSPPAPAFPRCLPRIPRRAAPTPAPALAPAVAMGCARRAGGGAAVPRGGGGGGRPVARGCDGGASAGRPAAVVRAPAHQRLMN